MNDSGNLRVGFDDQIFVAQNRGGISKYFVELITRLPKFGIEPIVVSHGTRNRHLAESGLVPELLPDSPMRARLRGAAWRASGKFSTSSNARDLNLDLMHHTFTMAPYLKRWSGPRVVTLFDMIPEVFPEYFKFGNPHFAKERYCRAADAIISISSSTSEDMLRFYGESLRKKVVEIPFGVGEQFLEAEFNQAELSFALPERYLLFVGLRGGYKHFDHALETYLRLAATDSELHFVIVGGGRYAEHHRRAIVASGLAERIMHCAPNDREIIEVYRRALTFVFPSVYEGFGLPTLEALATGTPTVLADASCSREVGGEAALYFEPGNIDRLEEATRHAMSDASRLRAKEIGPKWAREFTWDRAAESTALLYRSVFEASGQQQ